ncbi:hypothetical protein RCTITAN_27 [Rhodobacter phage RcTitan]|uniref:Uncharacterized protein n=1 Tax=Rhodobacter phage RcTitan TaxID=1662330 RepID=A0A0K1LKU4_9CAUD|nr:hypothetical protein RCTITAN_27 [Rhodobacter phage RcTitan]AKU43044.1 hypothetical protein RCTITAN_27 [Rhodobacter phage RcTitan]
MKLKCIAGTALHAGVESASQFGPVLLDFVAGQQSAIKYSNDYGTISDLRGNGALITQNADFFIFGINGGARILDLATNEFVTPWGTVPASSVLAIAQRKTDGLIAVATTGAPYLLLYTYPDFTYVPGPAAINPPPSACNAVSFSDDGTKLCVGHSSLPGLMVYDTTTWANLLPTLGTTPTSTTGLAGAAISPDGTKVAICGSNTGNRNRVWDLATGTLIYSQTSTNTSFVLFTPDNSQVIWQPDGFSGFLRYTFATSTASTFSISGVVGAGTVSIGRNIAMTDDGLMMVQTRGVTVLYDYTNAVLLSQVPNENNVSTPKAALHPGTQRRKLAGTVTDAATDPAERTIEAFDLASGRFLGSGVSDPVTGEFEFTVYSSALCYAVAAGEGSEQSRIISGITPALP